MTQETAKENLEVIAAFANGETIQYLTSLGEWTDVNNPMFIKHGKYRVKPKRIFALYNPANNCCETNLERFSEARIDEMVSRGWIKVELVQVNQ